MNSTTFTAIIIAAALTLSTANRSNAALKARIASPSTTAANASQIIIPKLEFKDATPIDVLQAISAASGIKIIYTITPTEKAGLTLSLRNIPASEALKIVSGMTGLKFAYEADSVRFSTIGVAHAVTR